MSDISRLISRSRECGHLPGRPCLCSSGTKLNGSRLYDPMSGRSVCFYNYPEASYDKGGGKMLRGKDGPELCCSFMKTSESKGVLSSPVLLYSCFATLHSLSVDSWILWKFCLLVFNHPEFQWIIKCSSVEISHLDLGVPVGRVWQVCS